MLPVMMKAGRLHWRLLLTAAMMTLTRQRHMMHGGLQNKTAGISDDSSSSSKHRLASGFRPARAQAVALDTVLWRRQQAPRLSSSAKLPAALASPPKAPRRGTAPDAASAGPADLEVPQEQVFLGRSALQELRKALDHKDKSAGVFTVIKNAQIIAMANCGAV
eukprot:gene8264-8452_t